MIFAFPPIFPFPRRVGLAASLTFLLVSGCREIPTAEPHIQMPPVTTYSLAPALAWTWPEVAGEFEVEIAKDGLFTESVLKDRTPVARYIAPNGLPPGEYFWRASAVRDGKRLPGEASGMLTVLTPDNVYEIRAGAGLDEILSVVQKAAKNTPAKVIFPERGNFRLPTGSIFLDLKGAKQLVIDGRGSSITFMNPLTGFARLTDCQEVSFCDFVIDNEPPPFTVGVITSVNKETGLLTFDVEPGHPDFDAPHILANWSFAMFLEPEPAGRILDDSPLVPGIKKETLRRTETGFSAEANQPSMVRVVEPGDRIVQFSRSPGGQSLFACQNSPDLAFLRIVNHVISGGHYLLLECDAARILRCSSMPGPGRGYGGNADGAHVRSSTVGPWIEGCYFEAVGDDGVAIYAKGIVARAKPASNQVVLDPQYFNLKTGDKMMIFNPRKGVAIGGDRVISSISKAEGGGWLVEFVPLLEETLNTGHPDPWNNDQVFNMTARHEGFVVRRNTFRDIRRYGVIARGQYGAIEENEFVGTSDSAIALQNEPYNWRNGLHSVGVSIAKNRIEHCNFSNSARGRGAIHVVLRSIGDVNKRWSEKPAAWKGHREISIVGNAISDWRGCAISLQNVDGLVLARNRIVGEQPALPDAPPARAVFLENVAGVSVAGNLIEGLQPGTEEMIQGGDVTMRPPNSNPQH